MKWQRKERVTFTLFSPSAAAASSAIFQVDGFTLASEIGVVRRLKSMEILSTPFYLCCEFFWRKSSQEHLTRSQTTYDRRSPVCESESYDRAEFRRLRTQNWGSGWLLGLMEVRRDWYGSHTSYNLKGLKLCTIDFKNNTDSLILCMIFFKSGLQLIANACDLKYSYPRPTSLSLNAINAINILQVDFLGETERNADKHKKSENRGWKLCTKINWPALAAMRRGTPLL